MARLPPIGFKSFVRTVTDDQSALCFAKLNPGPPAPLSGAGAEITAATIQILVTGLQFTINGAAEVGIGTYTGNSGTDDQILFADTAADSVGELITAINGGAAGQPAGLRRWRAGLGDFRPGFVLNATSGLVTAAANAMLGRGAANDRGMVITADSSGLSSANAIGIGIGTQGAREGGGQQHPDHFESGYTSTVAGVTTKVREAGRMVEEAPVSARFQVFLTGAFIGALFATTKVFSVWDVNNNLLYQESLGAGTTLTNADRYDVDNPIVVGPPGSPLFVEVTGTGALTDGPVTVQGFTRIS